MATSLKALRQDVGKRLAECITGAVDTPQTTGFIDVSLIDEVQSDTELTANNAWVKIVSGATAGDTRRITAFSTTTGQVTVSRAWTAPGAAAEYEIHKMLSPTQLDECIAIALPRCWFLDEIEIAPVSSQTEYPLAAFTWLTIPSQVFDVLWRTGDYQKRTYTSLPWFRVAQDAGVLTLQTIPMSASNQYSGIHNGAANAAVLTDTTQLWTVNSLIGWTIRNLTDGSQAIVTANGATTITGTLAGGTENDWDIADAYIVFREAYILRCLRPYAVLATDAATTTCPLEYARAAAILEIYNYLQRSGPADDTRRYEQQQQKALGVWLQSVRQYLPRPARRVMKDDGSRTIVTLDGV